MLTLCRRVANVEHSSSILTFLGLQRAYVGYQEPSMATALAYAARRTRLAHLGAIVASLSKNHSYAADLLSSSWRAEVSYAAFSSVTQSGFATKMSSDLFFGTDCRVHYNHCQQARVADSAKTSGLCESYGGFGGSAAVALGHPPRCLPPTGSCTAALLPKTYVTTPFDKCMLRQACGIMAGPHGRVTTTCRQPTCPLHPHHHHSAPSSCSQRHIRSSPYPLCTICTNCPSWRVLPAHAAVAVAPAC